MNEWDYIKWRQFLWVQMNTDFIGFDKLMCSFRACDTHLYRHTRVGNFKIFVLELSAVLEI